MKSFIQELRRRNVLKVAAVYVVTSWLMVQIIDAVVPMLLLPDWVGRAILLLLIVGFPIALILAWAFELTAEGIKRETDVDRVESITRETGRRIDFLIIGLLVIAVGYFAVDKFMLRGDDGSRVGEKGAASIAVLPFADMSSEQDQEYFADGISEELLNVLAGVPGFHVAGRTSSFAFKGQDQDLRRIADLLGVENVLEGSVRKSGDRVRITVQLVKAADGFHLWSETYDRTLDDIFAVQDEIAQAVVAALKTTLLGEEPAPVRMAATATGNTEAYDLYLRAKFQMHQRTPESLSRSIEYYNQVIELDPEYAPAWAGLGVAWILSTSYSDATLDLSIEQAETALDRAMALDPEDADVWAAYGLLRISTADLAESERALRRAIELNPNHVMANMWLGNTLAGSDAIGQGEAYVRAYRIDPLNLVVLTNYIWAMLNRGDAAQVKEAAKILRETHPEAGYGEGNLGELAYQEGRLDEAVSWFLKAYRIAPERINNFNVLSRVMIDLNELELADQWLRRGESLAPNDVTDAWARFQWYWKRDDLSGAETHLETSLEKYPRFPPIVSVSALTRMLQGDNEGALELFETAMHDPASEGRGALHVQGLRVGFSPWYTACLAALGRLDEAMEVSDAALAEIRSQRDGGMRYISPWSLHSVLARLYAVRGERERALDELRQAVADGARDTWFWELDPSLANIRDDLGFVTLVKDVEARVATQRASLEAQGLLLTPDQALTADL